MTKQAAISYLRTDCHYLWIGYCHSWAGCVVAVHAVATLVAPGGGKAAVSGSADKTLRVWDLADGRCARRLEGHGAAVVGVACFPLKESGSIVHCPILPILPILPIRACASR